MMYVRTTIGELFEVKTGNFHAAKKLDPGDTPLISCGDINHGLIGYFNIRDEFQHKDVLTVAYNGSPLTTKYRPYRFGAKDDIGILYPKETMSINFLLYVSALLNAKRWRYSYGRKCFKRKLKTVEVTIPCDRGAVGRLLETVSLDRRPRPVQMKICPMHEEGWRECRLDELFNLKRGDFHSIRGLADGEVATVSRTQADNGVVGYFEQPEGSTIRPPGLITVSTVSGDAFVQMEQFQATDNVAVCIPLNPMRPTSAYFIAAMINGQKWRYGYGRQPYIGKLSALSIQVPWRNGCLDEESIEHMVKIQPYWQFVDANVCRSQSEAV